MTPLRSESEREASELMCEYDEQREVVIHRFDTGDCRCRCGEKVVRKPIKRVRLKFGKAANDTDFT